MNRSAKSVLGVTLLEIMLVLAIAAMVIVMSIRYYQSATTSQQANTTMQQIQAIAATMDNLGIGAGSYAGITSTDITNVAGATALTSVTNQTITVTPATSTYTVSIPLNAGICASVRAKLAANTKISSSSCSGGTLSYTYDNTR